MNNRSIWTIIIVLVLVLLAIFYWWNPFGGSQEEQVPVENQAAVGEVTLPAPLAANHYFSEGRHSIQGSVSLPTPCHELSSEVFVAELAPVQARIDFTTTLTSEICAQVITDKFFSVGFEAPAEAVVSATWNGRPIELVLSQAGSGITK